jgi:mannose-1-phosphate guanylyltransferase
MPALAGPPEGKPVEHPLWSVVLAGGEGQRLSGVTKGVPKQFWRDGARPSLLQQTVARIDPLVPRTHTTIVVDRTHAKYAPAIPRVAHLLYQPQNRGTAAGVLLGLSPVLEASPDAIVILTPSDHAIGRLNQFRGGLLKSAAAVARSAVEVVVFGVVPLEPTADYGWITPGLPLPFRSSSALRRVHGFVEKPMVEGAAHLFRNGSLWNTMLVVAQARAVAKLYDDHLPDLAKVFAEYRQLPISSRDAFLTKKYETMRSVCFSRDLLTPARELAVFTWPTSVGWSDVGTPERLERWRRGAKRSPRSSGAA